MKREPILFRMALALPALAVLLPHLATPQGLNQRTFRPEDLFRIRQVGGTAWSPDESYVAIEFTRPGTTLDSSIPTNEIALLDVKARTLRMLTSNAAAYVGFFNAVWSPDGRRLAFLSVDKNATVQLWVWTAGAGAPSHVRDVDVRVGFEDPPVVWIDNDSLALLAWDTGADRSGSLYFRILRGRNVAEQWKRAFDGQFPSVSVLESGRATATEPPTGRLLRVNLRTGARTTLAQGAIHRVSASANGRFLSFLREQTGPPGQAAISYFGTSADADKVYDAVNWGTERHVIHAESGIGVPESSMPKDLTAKPVSVPTPAAPPSVRGARRLSAAPGAALYLATAADGSHLWLCGGTGQSMSSCSEIWQANEWLREIKAGPSESIPYSGEDGTPLTAWLLLPPDYSPDKKVPLITIVYPGVTYGATRPSSFDLLRTDFEHPQLFAALGYGVLLPSMPAAKEDARDSHKIGRLTSGVLPALDAVIARGIADPERIAVVGQSDGGFATLGLITQTTRFRSAIASAAFSDLISLYGTFYGQYRYGDAGAPQKGQVLRMTQMEVGSFGLNGPPWVETDRYLAGSPVLHTSSVKTPLMLVHGDLDFVPIQQAEEFFTALYRQEKRALFVRYQGEWHTISARANVLDLWKRIDSWLTETMSVQR